jgi:hypothetical protein
LPGHRVPEKRLPVQNPLGRQPVADSVDPGVIHKSIDIDNIDIGNVGHKGKSRAEEEKRLGREGEKEEIR